MLEVTVTDLLFKGGSRFLWGLKLIKFWEPSLRKRKRIQNCEYKMRHASDSY
jgi:hypothetical protein